MHYTRSKDIVDVRFQYVRLGSVNCLDAVVFLHKAHGALCLPRRKFSHLGDFIEDEKTATPSDSVASTMLKEQLLGVLDTLTPREEKVIRLRYGIDDGKPRTLEEVGREFNVTRERIRQIEAKALRKLRHPSRSKKLKDFLE